MGFNSAFKGLNNIQKLKNFKQMLEMRHAITTIARISKRNTPNIDGTIILQLLLNVAKTMAGSCKRGNESSLFYKRRRISSLDK
jgi:hypothetical protein